MKRIIIFSLMLSALAISSFAQKVKSIEGEYTYMQPSDENLETAKLKAVQKAQISAIAQNFGTAVVSKSVMQADNSKISYTRLGENEVKGEWVGNTREPQFEYLMNPATGRRIIKVKVWFKAREIVSKAVEVETALLCNGTSLRNEDDTFISGDQMYLYFKSPADGYLAVYEMGENDIASRLLPYSRSRMNSYRVEKNMEYIIFSPKHLYNGEQKNDVDEIVFTASKNVESDRICVLFSPNEFYCPTDTDGGSISGEKVGLSGKLQLPRQLPFEKFQKWLTDNRLKDVQLRYVPIDIEIHRK